MSGFFVPPSSSPPTTPGKSPSRLNGHSSFLPEHPSTTPAGPPPQSVFSTTPAGPPPDTTFGSSQLGTHLFTSKQSSHSSKGGPRRLFKTSPKTSFGLNRGAFGGANGRPSKPSFLGARRVETTQSASEQDDSEDDADEDAPGEEEYYQEDSQGGESQRDEDDDEYDEDEDESYTQEDAEFDAEGETEEDDYDSECSQTEDDDGEGDDDNQDGEGGSDVMDHSDRESTPRPFDQVKAPQFLNSTASAPGFDWAGLEDPTEPTFPSSTGLSPPPSQGTKRSRGTSASLADTIEVDLPPAKRRESALPRIALDLAQTSGTAGLHDADEVVIGTEDAISRLLQKAKLPPMARDYSKELDNALISVPRELIRVWKNSASKLEPEDENMISGIGPSEDSDGSTKAAYLANILFRLYLPDSAFSTNAFRSSHRRSGGRSTDLIKLNENATLPYPRILLDFLDNEHHPLEEPLKALLGYARNPASNPKFWDIIAAGIARGHLQLVRNILHIADFRYGWRPREGGAGTMGYSGAQLDHIHQAVSQMAELLAACPAVQDDNWDVPGPAWQLFRKRCEEAVAELSATGAVSPSKFSLSGRSTERLPERILSSLKIMYGILLGRPIEILSVSLDWLEATIGLTVWWNGVETATATGNLKESRRATLARQANGRRLLDVSPALAYRQRLAYAVDMVTNGPDDESLMVDTNNVVEVALASIFEGNLEGAFALLQTFSLPVTSAVLEIFHWAGHYRTANSTARPEGFDDSDLMVLNYAKPTRGFTKDDVNLAYSDHLFEKAELKVGRKVKEGWELAVDVSSRLNDPQAAQQRMSWLLSRVNVETNMRADKIAALCQAYGMLEEGRKACESFADHVSTTSHDYGTALIYYARAHADKKCKDVLDLLVSICLVRSAAYPPASPDNSSQGLDPHLASLIASPQESIKMLADVDHEAADILSEHLSGYATLRRFYDLRDQDLIPPSASAANQSHLRPKARLRAAAKAILACVSSAADPIQGGLFDASLASVVQVDVLLALLAEAGEFLGRQERVLGMPQLMALLRAVEDLQTVHTRIRAQTEECFRACLDARWDRGGVAGRLDASELLKKSVSGLTDSSGFSLVGSELMEASGTTGGASAGGRGAGKRAKGGSNDDDSTPRAWDWRDAYAPGASGNDLLRSLRAKIAQEIAELWLDEM